MAKDIGGVVTYTAEKPVEEYDSNKVFQNIGGAVTYTVAKPVEDHNSSKVLKDRNESECFTLSCAINIKLNKVLF